MNLQETLPIENFRMADLQDVEYTTRSGSPAEYPANGSALVYNSTDGNWQSTELPANAIAGPATLGQFSVLQGGGTVGVDTSCGEWTTTLSTQGVNVYDTTSGNPLRATIDPDGDITAPTLSAIKKNDAGVVITGGQIFVRNPVAQDPPVEPQELHEALKIVR